MSQEGMDKGVAERLARWRQEQENDPSAIMEDPNVEQDPLIKEIRTMIEKGLGSWLLKGREG